MKKSLACLSLLLFSIKADSKSFMQCHQVFSVASGALEQLGFIGFSSTQEILEKLSPDIKSTEVVLTTSRSLHQADANFPRLIYLDESQPKRPRILAFSLMDGRAPVLEVQDIDLESGRSELHKISEARSGALTYQTNPSQCFHCHSHGRPLLLGLAQYDYWPFTDPSSIENMIHLERRLSRWNTLLRSMEFDTVFPLKKQRALLRLALSDNSTEDFWRIMQRQAGQDAIAKLYNQFFEQRQVFLSLLDYHQFHEKDAFEEQALRLFVLFSLFHAEDFFEKLSLHVRPRNYQLSSEVVKSIKAWVETNEERGQVSGPVSFWKRLMGMTS